MRYLVGNREHKKIAKQALECLVDGVTQSYMHDVFDILS